MLLNQDFYFLFHNQTYFLCPFLSQINKLTSIKACLAPLVALFCEYIKNLKRSNRDSLLKYFLINSESNLLSTLEIAS